MKRGIKILIEGTDGSGKNTQSSLLCERLNKEGIPAEKMSFPRYNTPTGRIVAQCYLGKTEFSNGGDVAWFGDADQVDPLIASVYYAADRRAAIPDMERILDSGKQLILDRYYQSNMAHQGGKIRDKSERRRFFVDLGYLELEALKVPKVDQVIFLNMPWEVSLKLREGRSEKDGHESNLEHLKRAEEVYLQLADIESWTKIDCAPDRTTKTLRSLEEIHEEVYGVAIRKINHLNNIRLF